MKQRILTLIALLVITAGAQAVDYDLTIDGTKVTSSNASNVKDNGVFSYNASSNTLSIKGSYTSNSDRLVYSSISGLRVEVATGAVLTCDQGPVFFFTTDASVTSEGLFTVKSPKECGFYASDRAQLTIYDATISIQALWGISGPMSAHQQGEKVIIRNSDLTITTSGSSAGAICDFQGGIVLEDCAITAPEGAYIGDRDILDKDGKVATSVTIRRLKGVAIDETNFPDANFRQYVKDNCDKDKDGCLSDDEIAAVTQIILTESGISSMKGIEYFTELTILYCDNSTDNDHTMDNTFTTLDLSRNTKLEYLNCEALYVTTLDLTKNTALETVRCGYGVVENLNVTGLTALIELRCDWNQLKTLDVTTNTQLDELSAACNKLTALDVSNNTKLTFLNVNTNWQITALDVSRLTALRELHCCNNKISTLDLSDKPDLQALNIMGNKISEEEMGKIVEALPDVSPYTARFDVINLTSATEGNVINKYQVEKAYLKGWISYAFQSGVGYVTYEGSEPTGIEVVQDSRYKVQGDNVVYDLQGRRVMMPGKGLYIVNGKKVMIR